MPSNRRKFLGNLGYAATLVLSTGGAALGVSEASNSKPGESSNELDSENKSLTEEDQEILEPDNASRVALDNSVELTAGNETYTVEPDHRVDDYVLLEVGDNDYCLDVDEGPREIELGSGASYSFDAMENSSGTFVKYWKNE